MKKLKKVLLIGLFSFLFIVNVNASVNNIDSSEYSNVFSNFIKDNPNWTKESILNQCDILISKYMSTSYSYYTCSFILNESTSSGVYTYNGKYYTPMFNLYQYKSNATLQYYFYPGTDYHKIQITNSEVIARDRKIYLNLDFSTKSTGSANTSVHSSTDYYKYDGSKGVFQTHMMIFSAIVKTNLTNQYLIFSNNSNYSSYNYKLNDKYIGPSYNGGKVLFTDLYPSSYVDFFLGKQLYNNGTFNNSNVITYKIKDEKVGNNKELKIKFTFLNHLDVNANDISIYKYGSQVLTQHSGLICENSETDTICEFNLKYNVYDSVDDKLFFDFKFNNFYNVKVEDTSGNNGIYSNHKNVEFEYKQLNFKELSGAIFYLRNYDNFKFLSSYYDTDFVKFVISSDFDLLGRDVLYPNDIEYKNNYIFNDENDITQIDTTNMLKLNNFSRKDIVFEFDENLLNENKYSSFLIVNRNYLGSLDTDNQNLYVYYNSTLFNVNKLKYSVVVNNGTTNNYVSTENDFNFITNGSQNSYIGGINSGFIFEFDEEIKVQYKRGLEYFKDKIIDMFNFVNDFFNIMPEKFQVAFSLIFVLLIGIALFRLLL